MKLYSLPDFRGTDSAVPISQIVADAGRDLPPDNRVAMICFREVSGGTNSTRVGDSTVNATTGLPLSASDTLVLPNAGNSPSATFYRLNEVYIYAPASDTISISYGWW